MKSPSADSVGVIQHSMTQYPKNKKQLERIS